MRGNDLSIFKSRDSAERSETDLFPQPHAQVSVLSDGGEVLLYQWNIE